MTDGQVYSVAEWLAFNANEIKDRIRNSYDKARELDNTAAISYIQDILYYEYCITHPDVGADDAMEAFEDDRVLTVIARYFTKEFYYEH